MAWAALMPAAAVFLHGGVTLFSRFNARATRALRRCAHATCAPYTCVHAASSHPYKYPHLHPPPSKHFFPLPPFPQINNHTTPPSPPPPPGPPPFQGASLLTYGPHSPAAPAVVVSVPSLLEMMVTRLPGSSCSSRSALVRPTTPAPSTATDGPAAPDAAAAVARRAGRALRA
eukprot:350318-Chlamydomonas_euryale.AAC.14